MSVFSLKSRIHHRKKFALSLLLIYAVGCDASKMESPKPPSPSSDENFSDSSAEKVDRNSSSKKSKDLAEKKPNADRTAEDKTVSISEEVVSMPTVETKPQDDSSSNLASPSDGSPLVNLYVNGKLTKETSMNFGEVLKLSWSSDSIEPCKLFDGTSEVEVAPNPVDSMEYTLGGDLTKDLAIELTCTKQGKTSKTSLKIKKLGFRIPSNLVCNYSVRTTENLFTGTFSGNLAQGSYVQFRGDELVSFNQPTETARVFFRVAGMNPSSPSAYKDFVLGDVIPGDPAKPILGELNFQVFTAGATRPRMHIFTGVVSDIRLPFGMPIAYNDLNNIDPNKPLPFKSKDPNDDKAKPSNLQLQPFAVSLSANGAGSLWPMGISSCATQQGGQ